VIREIIGGVLMLGGAAFLFMGALGVIRMPDLYNRMQAGTKATTLGNLLALAGLGLFHPAWLPKIFVITLFVLVTNPISSHALARAAHKFGVPLASGAVKDALAEKYARDAGAAGVSRGEGGHDSR